MEVSAVPAAEKIDLRPLLLGRFNDKQVSSADFISGTPFLTAVIGPLEGFGDSPHSFNYHPRLA
jgi:hypothetical protein